MRYKPFDALDINDRTCFLTGSRNVEQIPAFPQWLLNRFGLAEKPFKLLDESIVSYQQITVPCSPEAKAAVDALDAKIESAFDAGFESATLLSSAELFQWVGKLLYGVLHHEIRAGIRQQAMAGERMQFSHSLLHRFGNFHRMLQSLVADTVFEGGEPWSIVLLKTANPAETFSYRDEINTLTFSLRINNFGLIACLQDNGENKRFHRDTLDMLAGRTLDPVQFEEVCARFFYSSYLFNRLPEYTFIETPETVYIEPMPFIGTKPLFDHWQNKTYGQVLENFWKPWGFTLFEIIKDPEKPLSFLDLEADFPQPVDAGNA